MITTHVLNTAAGKPAAGVAVTLERKEAIGWKKVGGGVTDRDGRVRDLGAVSEAGTYRLTFDLAAYSTFYPSAAVEFIVADPAEHYHLPLLLSGYGYSTYRGS